MNFRADRIGDELILAQLERKESDLLGAANALDVKASQLFAAGAFLAVQPAVVLAQSALDTPVVWMQAGTCIALVALVLCANEALRPRDYDTVNVTEEWRDELIAQLNPDQRELDGVAWLTWGLIDGLKKRIETAKRLHMERMRWLNAGRWLLLIALVCNFATLQWFAMNHLVSAPH